MAILSKRTSNKSLPQARGITSVTRGTVDSPRLGTGARPASSLVGTSKITNVGSGSKPISTTKTPTTSTAISTLGSKTTPASLTKKATTTTAKPSSVMTGKTKAGTSTSKPLTSVTKPAVSTPATKTTSVTGTGTGTSKLPTVTKTTPSGSSTLSKVLTGGATGAVIGAGTKAVIDKLTGGNKVTSVVKPTPGGTATKPVTGGTATKPTTSTTKPTTGGTKTTPSVGTTTPDPIYQYPTSPNGSTPYDDEGNLMPGWQLTENNDPVWVGSNDATPTGTTRSIGDTTVASTDGMNDIGDGYFEDSNGNIYTADGNLFATKGDDGYSLYEEEDTTHFADNTYTDPDTNEVWNLADDGTWNLADTGPSLPNDDNDINSRIGPTYNDDTIIAEEFPNENDYLLADNTGFTYDGGDDYEVKRGGLITMMRNGGVPHFADGDVVYGPVDTAKNYQNSGYLESANQDDLQEFLNNLPQKNSGISEESDGPPNFTPTPGVQYFDDGSYIQTFDDGSTMTFDSDGNVSSTTDGYQTSVDDMGNTTVVDGYGNIVSVYDPSGNVIPLGGGRADVKPITNVGGTGGTRMNPTTKPQTPKDLINEQKKTAEQKSTWQEIQDLIGGSGYLGAGAAGAILGSLLGNSDILGGGSGQNQQALDMSKVGNINPRTTDFGVGPAKFVNYEDYGTPEEMPDLYGTELGKNLNAPGFNPVNEGDYGYETTDIDTPIEDVTETEEVEGMADGGQPQGGLGNSDNTYFTYGKPVDPMQNLYNPQPMQQPQQPAMGGLSAPGMAPQGMPPQGMSPQGMAPQGMQPQGMAPQGMAPQNMGPQGMPPQGMSPMGMKPPGMRSGGLPAWSNVPVTNGRLNFRDGAPVHGPGDGQSDDIPAMLADGEYVIDAETVAQIGNGSTKAGAQALDKFRESIRAHKRSAPINKIPPKTKTLTSYLKGAK